jgi:hypothetical protein
MDAVDFNPNDYKLVVGQIWVPDDKKDFTLEIIDLDDKQVMIRALENNDTWFHELDGSDGFQDFLYSNNYSLK